MPLGWFSRAPYPILIAYCRHVVRAEILACHASAMQRGWPEEKEGLQKLDKLLGMAERETRAMTACARSMRLTHQSQILPRGAGRAVEDQVSVKPWE